MSQDIDLSKRKFSSRLVVERALKRGWKVRGFATNTAIHLLYPPGRQKPIKIFSASPPQTSYPAAKIAQDKYITNQILRWQGLPVPSELLVNTEEPPDMKLLKKFLDTYGQVVVKPLDASHGKGVNMNVTTVEKLNHAIEAANNQTEKSWVLVQEQMQGPDIRIVVIGYEFCDAINRIPASVTGDGVHTIQKLIALENQTEERGENYSTRLNVIPLDKAQEFLGSEGLRYVPAAGEAVQVVGVANIGMGGERNNIKGSIPLFLQDIAVQVATALDLPVCGVDFMVNSLPTPSSTMDELQPRIIEVNECPMLTMYEDMYSDEQSAIIDTYLDYLDSE